MKLHRHPAPFKAPDLFDWASARHPQPPRTRAGRWLSKRAGISGSRADLAAEIAGLGKGDRQ